MTGREKRAGAVVLAAAAVMTAGIPVYATGTQESSMNLNMSKEASYIMTIPKDTSSIKFGAESTVIGALSVTGDIGTKQQVTVTTEKTPFTDVKDADNQFSFALQCEGNSFETAVWNWQEVRAEEPTAYPLTVYIPTETWADVAAGEYTATLTFTAELQNIE